jgi:hypothetical protein
MSAKRMQSQLASTGSAKSGSTGSGAHQDTSGPK